MIGRRAEAGKPMVEIPGPSLPALIVNTTPGFAARMESTPVDRGLTFDLVADAVAHVHHQRCGAPGESNGA